MPVELHAAKRYMTPAVSAGRKGVRHGVTVTGDGAADAYILVYRELPLAAVRRDDESQSTTFLRAGEALLFIARFQPRDRR